METRANYVIVGLFAILGAVASLAFGWWIGRPERAEEPVPYEVVFDGEISGVRRGTEVLFNGIKVGEVKAIRLDPEDPRKVRMRVTIERAVPVGTDAVATLQALGLTGLSAVAIKGGDPDAPLLRTTEDEVPVIPSEVTGLDRLRQDLPTVLANLNLLLERISLTFSEENQANVSAILEDLEGLTTTLEKETATVHSILANLDNTVATLDRSLSTSMPVWDEQIQGLLGDARTAVQNADALVQNVDGLIDDTRGPAANFADRGLGEFALLVVEMRNLVVELQGALDQIRQDPSAIITGGRRVKEYTP
jgi:phospholipid/cholesterol/gamma-HCH transport system substrate-binding protein